MAPACSPRPLEVVLALDLVLDHVEDDVAVVHVDRQQGVDREPRVSLQGGRHDPGQPVEPTDQVVALPHQLRQRVRLREAAEYLAVEDDLRLKGEETEGRCTNGRIGPTWDDSKLRHFYCL